MQFKALILATSLALGLVTSVAAEDAKVVNVYNWSDYFDPAYLKKFEEKTGIKVNYDVYDSNEMLEAKLMAGGSGYDVVFPSGNFLARQIKAGVYSEIDKAKLSNYGNLDPKMLDNMKTHDPDNKYGVPYTWGTLGIAYNKKMIADRLGADTKIDSWDYLFKPEITAKLKDCGLVLMDAPSDVVSVAMNYAGVKDPNSEEGADLEKAIEVLKGARESVKYFSSSKQISDLANGEVCIAMGYNGDMLQAQTRAEEANKGVEIEYVIPKEGTQIWFDNMAIPADAKNKENAYQFINFVLEPETAASVANLVSYAMANAKATDLINDDIKNNPGIYPPAEVQAKFFPAKAHSASFDRKLSRAWTALKTDR
ncbi:polyamine ABC transporter substrate-binding protein [Thiofilum flexile]|uniref:polyamine ABC transporter substrate-binding protein n=1 Tax=Thiofilum flexile TaxID=125627 RepID=UPI000378B24D|nr:polyamine ABC transporter substrate-binding protein [Thiofilum flexile]